MSAVFVSYRRDDAQGWAGRLGADLAAAFGPVARFFDLASIAPGADFLQAIGKAIDEAAVVLVLIGPRWASLCDTQGRRRLDDPRDVVAAEVRQALARPVPVIPVLLGGARMPAENDLPEPLRPLSRRNAVELSDSRWAFDSERLCAAIEAMTPLKRQPAAAAPAAAAAAVRVGAGLELREAEVGRVTGARGTVPAGGVDVLAGAKLQQVKIGDITGVEVSPPAPERPA